MKNHPFAHVLGLLMAGAFFGCASMETRPDDMSVAEHRQHATQAREEAEREEAIARSPGVMVRETGPDHAAVAVGLREHARDHEAAARELLNFQAQECAGLPADFRGQCPLLQVEGVEETSDGVVLRLSPSADVDGSLRRIQCYLAYGLTQAFEGEPGCPFYVRGVHVIPVEGKPALRLAASDEGAAATLKRLVGEAFGGSGPR